MQRVRLRFHLKALDRRETEEYIKHRLAIGGCEGDLFADDCFDISYRFTGGVPRLINTLCDTALLCAFADGKTGVAETDVLSAIHELNWKEHESDTGIHEKLQQVQKHLPVSAAVTQIAVRSNGEVLAEHTFPLGRVIVGRSPDNEIYVKSKFVSRHHAQLVSDENGCVIEDLNSTNGLFLGAKQIKKYRLRDGDVVSLGVHELVYTDLRLAQQDTGESEEDLATAGEESEGSDDQDSAVNEQ